MSRPDSAKRGPGLPLFLLHCALWTPSCGSECPHPTMLPAGDYVVLNAEDLPLPGLLVAVTEAEVISFSWTDPDGVAQRVRYELSASWK